VAAIAARPTQNGQEVLLRDADSQTIGQVSLVQAEASSTVTLEFRSDTWTQVIVAAEGKMTLTLDGRTATLTWSGSAWLGDADAQALLTASQPYADFVQLVGAEAKLGVSVEIGVSVGGGSPADTPSKPVDMGGAAKPAPLCCGDVVTTGSGWAWYWEKDAQAMACKRATDTLQATCLVSSGAECCNLPAKSTCTACVNWGTGWACSQAGYLQYVCK
jgi:hypothetical protein